MRVRDTAIIVATLLVAAAVAGGLRRSTATTFPLRRQTGLAIRDVRPFDARLSGSSRWAACDTKQSLDSIAADCTSYRLDEVHAARTVDAARAVNTSTAGTVDAAWSLSVIDLATAQGDSRTLERAIDRLVEAAAKDATNPDLRNDLAVAYLARASRRQDATSLFLALNEIERAARLDSVSALIAFNQAVIIMHAGLFEEAAAAWGEFIRREPHGGWADEARRYQSTLIAQRSAPIFDAHASDLVAGAQRDPQSAREYVLEKLLPAWAANADAGGRSADSLLAAMRVIGDALAGRDSSAFHIARACNRNRRDVAAAARQFITASKEFRLGNYKNAAPLLTDAVRSLRATDTEPLAEWAGVLIGFVDIYAGRYAEADSTFDSIARSAAARGDVALQARAMWGSALSHSRRGATATAIDHYTLAAALYRQIGEDGNRASMLAQLADPLLLFDRDDAALDAKLSALAALARRRNRSARTVPLVSTGVIVRDLGLPHAAVVVSREATRAAAVSPRPHELPEALIQLANAECAAGRPGLGSRRLRDARRALASIDDSLMLARERMTVADAEAAIDAADEPALAISRLNEVVDYYTTSGLAFDRAGPLSRRGMLRLRTRDLAGARRDIEAAALAVEEQETKVTDPSALRNRAAARRRVFETLIALDIELGDTTGALLAAERARGNVISAFPRTPAGRVILGYSVLPDAIVLSIRSKNGERLVRIPVSEARTRESVEQVESLLRRGDESSEWRATSRRLYDVLMAPAEHEVRDAPEIVIAADGSLGRLSFGALRDSAGRYLGHQHVLVYSSSVRGGTRRPPRVDSRLIVGNPSFDRATFPDLASLHGAANEVAAVRSAYPSGFVLVDAAATKHAIVDALKHASVFHFAGHAQLVTHAPELSHLVLAKVPGGIADNVLSAEEIARLPLANLRLVILSSCGTTQARSRQDTGESGLADAFLRAGAAAVISSIWEADDEGTTILMRALHQRLSRGMSPADALRGAQIEVAGAPDVRRPLRIWSAFRYEETQ